MEQNIITGVFLPIAIAIIMWGMGLSLVVDDFRRVLFYPKAVAIGLFGQLVVLPLVGFFIASTFNLPPEYAVGLMIIALCPGGPTSNLISFLSRGDVALSVTLTAISNTVTVITIPPLVNWMLIHFLGQGTTLQLPFVQTVAQIALLTIVPVALGMWMRAKRPEFAAEADFPVKVASVALLILVILAAIIRERAIIVQAFIDVGPATLMLSAMSMLIGFTIAAILRLNWSQRITSGIEVGIQNGTLAIALASGATFLNNPAMAIPPAIYSLVMFGTAAAFGFFVNARIGRRQCACCRDRFHLDIFDLNRTKGERDSEIPAAASTAPSGRVQTSTGF